MHKPPNCLKSAMTHQYIVQFDSAKLPRIDTDFLVIGNGNAGLKSAIEANQHGDVLLITKSTIKENNLCQPQEELANIGSEDNAIASYVESTLKAGSGLCDETAVELMVEEGVQGISELIQQGAHFNKEEETILVSHFKKQKHIRVIEGAFAIDFMTQGDRCYGAVALIDGALYCIFAKVTLLASDGLGHIYQSTFSTDAATGDGFAAAWRAGCKMMGMEFIQFHPTMLFLMETPYFLIPENVREEGGILIQFARGTVYGKIPRNGGTCPVRCCKSCNCE